MPNEPERVLALRAEILRYRATHPRAADTAEGVRQFWLENPLCSLDEVEQALGLLVQAGELGQRTLANGRILYVDHDDG